ncbi:unnamed protein product [Didymodactylos carnosus]|uniref:Solute carrier family 15 member 1 n=1 Tax=Didymodactylos carnosus TaxID=1234261 RepID=A0A813PGN6_9BILA|nr:unnamed protein product [Didymodactylos carnosus]CAF1232454.1 unnamed protein product [Didymodactylos carnosus]CAF3529809.1 unnamed protein product [Didymodactylos carnosus]CAF4040638.1 unnamed protein product [Didymodactylos carnosus]
MALAVGIFVAGTPKYKHSLPTENIIARFLAIIFMKDIEDVRTVIHVLVLFVPLPMFWALYDQVGSRWTFQASLMDGSLGALGTIKPDQMQAFNSLLLLALIPIFEKWIYPFCAKCHVFVKPLQRIFVGLILLAIAFVCAAILQAAIEARINAIPVRYNTKLFNTLPCVARINQNRSIESYGIIQIPCTALANKTLLFDSDCNGNGEYIFTTNEMCPSVIVLSGNSLTNEISVTPLTNPITIKRGTKGFSLLRVVSLDGKQTVVQTIPNKYTFNLTGKLIPSEYQTVLAASYRIKTVNDGHISSEKFDLDNTAVYTVLLFDSKDGDLHGRLITDIPANTIHVLWQIIQYFILTCAEILFSITGIAFAYSQAPKRYKTVVAAAWLLTVAVGNLFVAFVAESRLIADQTTEFLVFAALMVFCAFLFGVLAIHYQEQNSFREEEIDEDQQLIINGEQSVALDDTAPNTR